MNASIVAFLLSASGMLYLWTMMEDPYRILGVGRQASAWEIRRAYYRLAKRWHPDVNQSPDAKMRFQSINAAYQVLTDPDKRRKLDISLDGPSPAEQRKNYYKYGTSVRNPGHQPSPEHAQAQPTEPPSQQGRSLVDHFLFASLLFLGLTTLLYGIIDAILKDPEDGSHYYGLVMGLAFTGMLILGWRALAAGNSKPRKPEGK